MPFSLPSVVKRTPAASLRGYFAERDLLGDIDCMWDGDKHQLDSVVLGALHDLASERRETVFADFEEVQQLCDWAGQRALRDVVADTAHFDQLDGPEARALFVLLGDPRGFAHALSLAYAARQYHGRAWSGYFVSRPEPPSDDHDALEQFEAELRGIFLGDDASGRRMVVERFERPSAGGPVYQFCIFVEAPPQTGLEFVAGQPRRMTRKPVIEAMLSYNPTAGTLDIVAQGGKPVREEVGEAFATALLAPDVELLPAGKRAFNLERLREPIAFAFDPADGIRQVVVAMLRLRDLTTPTGRLTLDATDGPTDIHAAAQGWFGDANPLRSARWAVEQVKLQILFRPDRPGHRDKKVSIELRAPNGSNLKEQVRHHDLISSKYLAQWGLVRDRA